MTKNKFVRSYKNVIVLFYAIFELNISICFAKDLKDMLRYDDIAPSFDAVGSIYRYMERMITFDATGIPVVGSYQRRCLNGDFELYTRSIIEYKNRNYLNETINKFEVYNKNDFLNSSMFLKSSEIVNKPSYLIFTMNIKSNIDCKKIIEMINYYSDAAHEFLLKNKILYIGHGPEVVGVYSSESSDDYGLTLKNYLDEGNIRCQDFSKDQGFNLNLKLRKE